MKRSVLYKICEIVMSIFGGESSGGYSQATIDKIKKIPVYFARKKNLQSRQIQNEFVLINLTRVKLGDHRKLLHKIDLTII